MDAAVATSLFRIVLAAVLAPLIAGAVPRRLVPVLDHGAVGESLPVVAMATLLGARGALGSLILPMAAGLLHRPTPVEASERT